MKTSKKTLFLILLLAFFTLPFFVSATGEAIAMVKSIMKALLTIGGTVVVIGWVITGILWLTSAGSPEKTATAKKAMIACVIGTIVIILAPWAYDVIQDLLGFVPNS